MDYSYFDVMRNRRQPVMNNTTAVGGRFPLATPVGMAYVPFQTWSEPYDLNDAFCSGTLFPELDYPFEGEGCTR